MKEVYNMLKNKGLSDDQFDQWVINPNVKKLYPQSDLNKIKEMWYPPKPKTKKKKPAAKPLDSFKYFNENEQE